MQAEKQMSPWRRLMERDLLTLTLVTFVADVTMGLLLPIFPLVARQLGASLPLVGSLGSVRGVGKLAAAVPVGLASDRWGRRTVIGTGFVAVAVVSALLVWAGSPIWLAPAALLLGASIVALFAVGAALVGDLTSPGNRGVILGVYSTAMGLGFAVGPLVAGLLARPGDYRPALLATLALAAAAALPAFRLLPRLGRGVGLPVSLADRLRLLGKDRSLLAISLAVILFALLFDAAVINFVPLQAAALGFDALAVGGLFTIRSLASTFTRLPGGVAAEKLGTAPVLTFAMLLGGTAVLSLAWLQGYAWVAAALALEGISYGVFITAGRLYVMQNSAPEALGGALGAYELANSVTQVAGPILFGFCAAAFGLPTVFAIAGAAVLLGTPFLAPALWRRP